MREEKRIKVRAFISLFCCTKVGTKIMSLNFFLLNVMPGTVSCYTHWRATPSCSNRIISAPVSHVCSLQ